MKYIKKIIICLFFLELFNVFIGFCIHGTDVFLPFTGFSDPPLYYDMDVSYGVTRQRNTKQMMSYPWGGVLIETNSLGFRDDEFKERGVLVLGNSFVEGYGLQAEDRFSEILEKKLHTPFNNAGSAGVWTPIQSFVLLKELLNNKILDPDRILLILTPGQVSSIGKRNPKNDPNRNFPYKIKDSIAFYKAPYNNFGSDLSLVSKIKRFSKSLLLFKIYNSFKYYGVAKKEKDEREFNKENLDWFLKKISSVNFEKGIDVVVINNLMRTELRGFSSYKPEFDHINFHVLQFPDRLENYYISNGHLNEKGNKVLAELLEELLFKE